jgi:chemotaxis signal transduction protein
MINIKKSDMQPVPDVLPPAQRALAKAIVALETDMICFLDPEPMIDAGLIQAMAA